MSCDSRSGDALLGARARAACARVPVRTRARACVRVPACVRACARVGRWPMIVVVWLRCWRVGWCVGWLAARVVDWLVCWLAGC